jgi:hypothetical protein
MTHPGPSNVIANHDVHKASIFQAWALIDQWTLIENVIFFFLWCAFLKLLKSVDFTTTDDEVFLYMDQELIHEELRFWERLEILENF